MSHGAGHRLVRGGIRLAVWVGLLAVGATDLFGQTPKPAAEVRLPPAQEVIARHVQAVGGREAILRLRGLRVKGTFEMPNQGITGEFEALRAAPNKQVTRVVLAGRVQIATGFDGKVGWVVDPVNGPRLLRGRMLDQARDEAEFYDQLREPRLFESIETVATTQFAGQECYQLRLVWKSGREATEFYSRQTGLRAGAKGTQELPNSHLDTTSQLSDYQRYGELLQPTKLRQRLGNDDQLLTVTSLSTAPIQDSEFELPDPVKALLTAPPPK